MLSLFPGLLFLGPLATTVIRIAVGLFFVYAAYRVILTIPEITRAKLPIIGHVPAWLAWISGLVTLATGILLIVGLYTQGAAIVGMLIALKHGIGTRKYASIVPFSAGTYLLLFVICFSLLFSGAGALGIDLPL